MTAETAPLSPFAPWAEDFARLDAAVVSVRELPFLGQFSVRLDADSPDAAALPGPGRASVDGDVRTLWLGPDEWLVLTPSAASAAAELPGAVIDVSAQRTTLLLTGPRVADVLAKGCSLDLDVSVRPVGSCVTTLLAQTGVTLVREDDGFLLLVRASFADYLARWLLDASIEID